ncbi:MAG: TetM/TetW/TetO/TetS family tetracycline resistance ribosomal protection protein [Oscillospiraceae bacterium]|nr:TetM/TetW/TetO/TetS family tetracycline resistance ribosomal protection protein [Oscillospiraceae bacterium]
MPEAAVTTKQPLSVGILAHVDAGKTTLAEALLFRSGALRKQGRVDHRDALLDHHDLERRRGITIFANEGRLQWKDRDITLVDTPGHVDFSAEAERVLSVLDCAVLVISGTDGIQAHTDTLWRLLRRYKVPAMLFVTKMDLPGPGRRNLLSELRSRFGEGCMDLTLPMEDEEPLATLSDEALEEFLETGHVSHETRRQLFRQRLFFPVFFGSGLKLSGIERLLDTLESLPTPLPPGGEFGARVFRISRDGQGNRLTHVKVTGGELRVRDPICCRDREGNETFQKAAQLRLYAGAKFTQTDFVPAGGVCAVLGLTDTFPGQGLGAETNARDPVLEPVYKCAVLPPQGTDERTLLPILRQLEEEDPQLRVLYDPTVRQIQVQLMGQIQGEILQSILKERFDLEVTLRQGGILYKETIAAPVEGVGHFEPLRHYAEVHLTLEPMERGAGLVLDSSCPTDILDLNWQRLILTHLGEKTHLGVLTGSPITDMKITLTAGRAHLKHTEGGDFRQATYRAVRQGLMQAESILLEPCYAFRLELPMDQLGRAVTDLQTRGASFSPAMPMEEDMLCITGRGPVSALEGYSREVAAYTRGRGRFFCRFGGYEPCGNQKSVVESINYDPRADLENTPDSVFCAHGAGFNVRWDKVQEYMHLDHTLPTEKGLPSLPSPRVLAKNLDLEEKELQALMLKLFGEKALRQPKREQRETQKRVYTPPEKPRNSWLVVDGYNVIFAWEELKSLAGKELSLARQRLCDLLSSYCSYKNTKVILVFDGYRVAQNAGTTQHFHGMEVVYTKSGETADTYIERLCAGIGKNDAVRVVTSDGLIRLSALGSGILRMSAKEFRAEVQTVEDRIASLTRELSRSARTTLSDVTEI